MDIFDKGQAFKYTHTGLQLFLNLWSHAFYGANTEIQERTARVIHSSMSLISELNSTASGRKRELHISD